VEGRDNERMAFGVWRKVDLIGSLSAVLAAAMAVVYIQVMQDDGEQPLAWVLVVLLSGTVLAAFASWRPAPHRTTALILAGIELTVLGVLALLTIGFPILIAGALALWAGARG
jgi:hypothetical protein